MIMNMENCYYRFKLSVQLLKELKNPISTLLYFIGLKKTVTVKSKKLGPFEFNSNQKSICNSLFLVLPYVKEENKEECAKFFKQWSKSEPIIELDDYKIVYDECAIFAEKFAEYLYNFKNLKKGDVIIDIGSHVGDTALDFASKGLIVYGFEPVKELYQISLRNAELNPQFNNQLNLLNYAVSYKKGKVLIDSLESTSDFANSQDSYEVEVITIDDILNDYSIKPKFLKMDCEGCEFDIIRNSDLSIFDEIIFEHHAAMRNDNYNSLVEILKNQGFNIDLSPIWLFDMENIGIIHAYKH